jgi:hypothetical protein
MLPPGRRVPRHHAASDKQRETQYPTKKRVLNSYEQSSYLTDGRVLRHRGDLAWRQRRRL